MSPMGEPFQGRAGGEDGLIVWFQQADRNHDGSITRDEMTADAQRFFETLDTNHDGEIDPDETTHYEQVIAPQVHTGFILTSESSGDADSAGGRGGRHGRRRQQDFASAFGGDDEASAGRFGLLQIPEPITSADADFNRGVSALEFKNAAVQRFGLLDINHTGRLTLPELQRIQGAARSAFRRNVNRGTPAPQLDPQGDTEATPVPH
jgi:Ca2+-binding EF-hand superfamily protein